MKKITIIFKMIFLLFTVLQTQAQNVNSTEFIEKKSKIIADEVVNKLDFTSEFRINSEFPVYFEHRLITKDFSGIEYKNSPMYNQPKGRKYIVVCYHKKDDTSSLENHYVRVSIWLDTFIPFFIQREDLMAMNLDYDKEDQPYYRVSYETGNFKYPTLVKPNEILVLEYYNSESGPDSSGWTTVVEYELIQNKSKGIKLLSRKEEPYKGNIKRIYKVQVISDEAIIYVKSNVSGYEDPY